MNTTYLDANRTAGYSGFVVYMPHNGSWRTMPNSSFWMVPGTFFDDWDNQ